uniref:Uncharacterized protein n=1 Tax=Oryza meridionalis TaxID=40149 RepID=A0A0E0CC29_9ORYZ
MLSLLEPTATPKRWKGFACSPKRPLNTEDAKHAVHHDTKISAMANQVGDDTWCGEGEPERMNNDGTPSRQRAQRGT